MSASPTHRRPEILAPAGDRECLQAAVKAGADAVYFGLAEFNARARATNFDAGGLGETMAYLHAHGRKGYVTLNTLLFDDELGRFERSVRACAEASVDAVIVQDIGAVSLVRAIAPDLPVHASTQMTCTDAGSAEFACELGASRVIVARELSLDDIATIRAESDVEVEAFVHGALCIAYSGQCLTSEALGGRSANRGACAQACRLPYELVVDGELQPSSDKAFLLSPEDLEASDVATDLWNLAVSSLKIEGRLKGPAYVGAAVRLYRAALDRHSPHGSGERASTHGSDDVRQAALQHFSRGSGPGFFRGVDHQRLVEGRSSDHRGLQVGVVRTVVRRADRDWIVLESSARALAATTEDARPGSPTLAPDALERSAGILVEGGFGNEGEVGGRIWDTVRDGDAVRVWLGPDKAVPVRTDQTSNLQGRRVFRTSAPQVERRTLDALRDAPAKRPLRFELVAREGEFPNLVATTGDGIRRSCVVQAPWVRATSRQVDEALLADKLGRLKDSPFEFAGVAVQADVPGVVPFGAINRARRELVDALIDARPTAYATTERSATALVGEARSRIASSLPLPRAAEDRADLVVLSRTIEQARAARSAGASAVALDFLELTGTGAAVRELRNHADTKVGVAPPRIRKPGEEKIDRFLRQLEPDFIYVRGLGALGEWRNRVEEREDRATFAVGDFSLNVTNTLAADLVLSCGVRFFTPSFDLDAAQLSGCSPRSSFETGLRPSWARRAARTPCRSEALGRSAWAPVGAPHLVREQPLPDGRRNKAPHPP